MLALCKLIMKTSIHIFSNTFPYLDHMKIHLQRKNNAVHFESSSELSAAKVHIEGAAGIGGEGKGVRPMELVLMALGSCSVFDLYNTLTQQRQTIEEVQVTVEGQRRDDGPNRLTHMHLTCILKAQPDENQGQQAAESAVWKYCPVHDMLAARGVELTYR